MRLFVVFALLGCQAKPAAPELPKKDETVELKREIAILKNQVEQLQAVLEKQVEATAHLKQSNSELAVKVGSLEQDVTSVKRSRTTGGTIGGFGGTGGGGFGTGTIGTGTWVGVKGGASKSKVPPVRVGSPTVKGDLDKAIIRRYIRRKLPQIKYCYERRLLQQPKLKGTVHASFTIGKEGRVTKMIAKGVHRDVSSCIGGVIKRIHFPKPRGGGNVVVRYPFRFVNK